MPYLAKIALITSFTVFSLWAKTTVKVANYNGSSAYTIVENNGTPIIGLQSKYWVGTFSSSFADRLSSLDNTTDDQLVFDNFSPAGPAWSIYNGQFNSLTFLEVDEGGSLGEASAQLFLVITHNTPGSKNFQVLVFDFQGGVTFPKQDIRGIATVDLGVIQSHDVIFGNDQTFPVNIGLLPQYSANKNMSAYTSGITFDDTKGMPVIASLPTRTATRVDALEEVVFSILGKNGPLQYQWRKNRNDIQGANLPNLVLTDVMSEDAGSYSCRVTNSVGSVECEAVSLEVQRIRQNITFPPVKFNSSSNIFPLNASSDSGLPIEYTSNRPFVATIENGTLIPRNNGVVTITASQQGSGAYFSASASQQIEIDVFPKIVKDLTSKTVNAMEEVEFSIDAQGAEELKYQWFKDGSVLEGETSSKLYFSEVSLEDSGVYSCSVSNIFGESQSSLASLEVNKLSQTITFLPLQEIVISNEKTQLTAYSDSGLPLSYSSSNLDVASIGQDGRLEINGVGTTEITAFQDGNSFFNSATPVKQIIIVKNDLILESHTQSLEALAQSSVVLSVRALSHLEIIYQWKKDGLDLAGENSPTLILSELTTDDQGDYSCSIRNSFGEIESPSAALVVNRLKQKISLALDDELFDNAGEIPINASADSSLPLSYLSSDESVATVINDKLQIISEGETTIHIFQQGNNIYLPADPVEHRLTVKKFSAFKLDLSTYYESQAGESISIDATPIIGTPPEDYSFQWYFKGFPVPDAFGGKSAIQTIDGIPDYEGSWKVVVTNSIGSVEHSFEYRIQVDTDTDGYSDGYEEFVLGTNPELSDTDSDGIDDFTEIEIFDTNPIKEDTDGDGFLDSFEIANGASPLMVSSIPSLNLKVEFSDIGNIPALTLTSGPITGGQLAIEQSFDLSNWTPIVLYNGTGAGFNTTVTRPKEEMAYYRVRVLTQK